MRTSLSAGRHPRGPGFAAAGLVVAAALVLVGCTSASSTSSTSAVSPTSSAASGSVSSAVLPPGSDQVTTAASTPGLTAASVPYGPPSATSSAATTVSAPGGTAGTTGTATSPATVGSTTGRNTISAPRTTQSPGDINETVPTSALTTAPTVPLTATANFGGKVTGQISKVTRTTLTAQGPGEFAGPGVEVAIAIRNGSSAAIDLSAVTVTILGANGVAAIPVQSGNVVDPFSGSVAPGASASGVYVFSLHSGPSNPVVVTVNYSAAAPVVAFAGRL